MSNTKKIVRSSKLINKKIISDTTDKEIGKCYDIIYNFADLQIEAIIIDQKGLLSNSKSVLSKYIKDIASDQITIYKDIPEQVAKNISARITSVINEDESIQRAKIVTDKDEEIAKVNDVLFDPGTMKIKKIEVSQGILEDAISGHKIIDVDNIINIGFNRLLIKEKTKDDLQKENQNLTLKEVKEKLGKALSETKKTMQETKENASKKITKSDNNNSSFKKAAKEFAIGKYLTLTITDQEENVIGRKGEVITQEIVDKAEENGKLSKVVANTSGKMNVPF
jgi:uncharacterized protein YrrD